MPEEAAKAPTPDEVLASAQARVAAASQKVSAAGGTAAAPVTDLNEQMRRMRENISQTIRGMADAHVPADKDVTERGGAGTTAQGRHRSDDAEPPTGIDVPASGGDAAPARAALDGEALDPGRDLYTVRLPAALVTMMDARASLAGVSRGAYMRRALVDYVSR